MAKARRAGNLPEATAVLADRADQEDLLAHSALAEAYLALAGKRQVKQDRLLAERHNMDFRILAHTLAVAYIRLVEEVKILALDIDIAAEKVDMQEAEVMD